MDGCEGMCYALQEVLACYLLSLFTLKRYLARSKGRNCLQLHFLCFQSAMTNFAVITNPPFSSDVTSIHKTGHVFRMGAESLE